MANGGAMGSYGKAHPPPSITHTMRRVLPLPPLCGNHFHIPPMQQQQHPLSMLVLSHPCLNMSASSCVCVFVCPLGNQNTIGRQLAQCCRFPFTPLLLRVSICVFSLSKLNFSVAHVPVFFSSCLVVRSSNCSFICRSRPPHHSCYRAPAIMLFSLPVGRFFLPRTNTHSAANGTAAPVCLGLDLLGGCYCYFNQPHCHTLLHIVSGFE